MTSRSHGIEASRRINATILQWRQHGVIVMGIVIWRRWNMIDNEERNIIARQEVRQIFLYLLRRNVVHEIAGDGNRDFPAAHLCECPDME